MSSPLQAIFQFTGLKPSLVAPNSRYLAIEMAKLTTPDGRTVAYLRRRFCPQPAELAEIQAHIVADKERLDIIAARYFGDPELFWRISDANGAMRPADLTASPGRVLRICLPAGIPGGTSAS
jgi:hypothetical protein